MDERCVWSRMERSERKYESEYNGWEESTRGNGLRYYRGAVYTGVVRTVGWHPERGFGATVTYSDGFTEILKIEELEVFMLADRARKTDILDQSKKNRHIGSEHYSQGHI